MPIILEDGGENKRQTEISGTLYTELEQRSQDSLYKIPYGTNFRAKLLNPTKIWGRVAFVTHKKSDFKFLR
jgi:hypothetical protein